MKDDKDIRDLFNKLKVNEETPRISSKLRNKFIWKIFIKYHLLDIILIALFILFVMEKLLSK